MKWNIKNIFSKPSNYVEIEKEQELPKNYVEKDYGLTPKEEKPKSKWSTLKPIELSKIKKVNFPDDRYHKIETPKNQIVLHHTVSGKGIQGDVNSWINDTRRIATPLIIDHDGIVHQCFSSKYWAHHLGIQSAFLKDKGFKDFNNRNLLLNERSIGIEIDSWGGLVLGDGTNMDFSGKVIKTVKGKYYADYGNIVDVPMIHYPDGFRGFYYFEKYTDEQIQTLGELLLFFSSRYNIPLNYNEGMWDISNDALSGVSGVWSHTSYVYKSDAHPQPELIDMLKNLKNLV